MSAALVEGFFPKVVHLARSHGQGQALWDFFFPPSVQVRCPCPETALFWLGDSVSLRWPAASVFCLLGMLIGFAYGIPLLRLSFRRRAVIGTQKPMGVSFDDSFAWGSTFFWYGLMCLGGLFYHCFSPRLVLAYYADVFSTACCCFSLISACFRRGSPSFLAGCHVLTVALTLGGPQIAREMLYLVPALAATAIGIAAGAVKWRAAPFSAKLWICAASLAAVIATAAVPADRWLCRTLGPNFSLIVWFFLGSDFALLFLYKYFVGVRKSAENHHKST